MDFCSRAVAALRHLSMTGALIAGANLCLAGGHAFAQPPDGDGIARPEGARRVTRVFDFEEPGNPHPVPAGWERAIDNPRAGVRRAGFPAHNEPRFDLSIGAPSPGAGAEAGRGASVIIPTQGGSSALRLVPGEVAVFVDADYAVTGRVRSAGLRHARAFITARFLDSRRATIPGSEVRSRPAPPDSGGLWTELAVELGRAVPGAAWLQIDLELLQPDEFLPADARLGKHEVRREDVSGQVWFDDITVLQVPRVRLGTFPPGNIVAGPSPVQIEAVIHDLGGDLLTAELRIRNLEGDAVDRFSGPADPGGKPLRWSPRLPAFGWYMAELDVSAGGRVVARSRAPIVWLSPGSATPAVERRRFGLVINPADPTPEGMIADVGALIGSGFVVLPAWDSTLLSTDIDATVGDRRAGIERLLRTGQEITLCIPGAPADVAAALAIDPAEMGELARLAPERWAIPLSRLLDLFGQRLLRYQVGPTGTDSWQWDRDPASALQLYRDTLAKVVPSPLVGVPWPAGADLAGPLFDGAGPTRGRPDLVTLTVPIGFEPREAMARLGASWDGSQSGGSQELTAVIELPDGETFGHFAAATELARRAIEFWAAFDGDDPEMKAAGPVPRLAIAQPWALLRGVEAMVSPSPVLPVLRELIGRLDGRRVVGEFPASAGVRCLILAARRTGGEMNRGALAAWNISAPDRDAFVDVTALGADLRVFDVFGNLLAGGVQTAEGRSIVRLGQTPVFIEGADPYLALFAAGARIEPGFLRAVASEHYAAIVLRNPWPIRLTGQVQVKDADAAATYRRTDWTFWPQGVVEFAAGPGEEVRIPLTISFGASQIAGIKDLWLVARVQADREYPPIRLRSPIEIGLEDLELQAEVTLSPGLEGPDAVASASVTNKGSLSRAVRLEAAAWGFPTQQLHVSNLAPGQTVTRRFLLKGGAATLKGKRVVVSVADDEEAERLNKAVIVP